MKLSATLWKWLMWPFRSLEQESFLLRCPSITMGVSKLDFVLKNSFSALSSSLYWFICSKWWSYISFAKADAALPRTSTNNSLSPREHSSSSSLVIIFKAISFGYLSSKAWIVLNFFIEKLSTVNLFWILNKSCNKSSDITSKSLCDWFLTRSSAESMAKVNFSWFSDWRDIINSERNKGFLIGLRSS